MTKLQTAIEHAINCASAENGSDTPDFILAEYLIGCLAAYDRALVAREKWYGREPIPVDTVVSPSPTEVDSDPPQPDKLSLLGEVNYGGLPPESTDGCMLIGGRAINIREGNAQIEVHQIQDLPGWYVRIYNNLGDGRKSALKFRLTDEATIALYTLLGIQLDPGNRML